MEVTRVKFIPIERHKSTNPLVVCTVVFDDVFMVHDIKIYEGDVVVMPQRRVAGKSATGEVKVDENGKPISNDLCHPINKKFFEEMKDTILEGYANYLATGQQNYTVG